MFGMQHREEAD